MSSTAKRFANELVRRELARSSLDDYANYMATSQHLDFVYPPARHHRLITRALDLLLTPLDDPRHPVDRWGEPVTKLLLTAPPGSAKSTYCSVQLPTYVLVKNPHWHILCSSNVGGLAESFNRRRRSACLTQEWQNVSDTKLNPEALGVEQFFTLRGGSIKAAGVGATIVGIRSNMNILDDPIESWEQAQSEGQLAKIWDWYEGEYRNRMYGVEGALEVLMHQRWSRNDPAGVLLRLIKSGEERGWAVINLPLVAPESSEEPDPVGREPGEVLWPENQAFNAARLETLQRDPAKWAALYQQQPLDEEGGWVGQEHIQLIQPAEWADLQRNHQYRFLAAGDIALSINKGDWTIWLMGAITPNRDLVICDMVRHRESIEDTVKKLYELNQTYRPTGWCLDDDNATKVFTRYVYEYARSQNVGPAPLDLMPMRGRDKEIRAAAIRGYFRSSRVFIVNDPRWAPGLIQAVLRFPGEPDDEVDTLGLLGRKMVQMGGIDDIVPKKPEPIEGLIVEKDGVPHLNMGLGTMFEERERGLATWNLRKIG